MEIDRRQFLKSGAVVLGQLVLGSQVADEKYLYEAVMKPFIEEAERRRATSYQELQADMEPALAHRVNLVLYGYGVTHEPFNGIEQADIGSIAVFSYDRNRRVLDIVSINHDILAPDIFNYLKKRDSLKEDPWPIKIYRAYHDSGLSLLRAVTTRATGLSIDYCVAGRDEALATLINQSLGSIKVNVPKDFRTFPYYFAGKKYEGEDDTTYTQGVVEMDGRRAIGFIKAVPYDNIDPETGRPRYDKSLEHHPRARIVFQGMWERVREKMFDPSFWWSVPGYFQGEQERGNFELDFDPKALLFNNFLSLIGGSAKALIDSRSRAFDLPEVGKAVYFVDAASGDGGVQWLEGNARVNPLMAYLIREKQYFPIKPNGQVDTNWSVPAGSEVDPFSENLKDDYWAPLRRRVLLILEGTEIR